MIRRLFAAAAAAVLITSVSIASVSAAASPQAVLRASFESYMSGGNGASFATWGRGAQAWFHAANTGIDLENGAARIGLFDGADHCSSNLFGIWVITWDPDKVALAAQTWDLAFGPVGGPLTPLAAERSAVRKVVDPQGSFFAGVTTWWQSVGVPVYGHLAPGDYTFHAVSHSTVWGDAESNPTVHIVTC